MIKKMSAYTECHNKTQLMALSDQVTDKLQFD